MFGHNVAKTLEMDDLWKNRQRPKPLYIDEASLLDRYLRWTAYWLSLVDASRLLGLLDQRLLGSYISKPVQEIERIGLVGSRVINQDTTDRKEWLSSCNFQSFQDPPSCPQQTRGSRGEFCTARALGLLLIACLTETKLSLSLLAFTSSRSRKVCNSRGFATTAGNY